MTMTDRFESWFQPLRDGPGEGSEGGTPAEPAPPAAAPAPAPGTPAEGNPRDIDPAAVNEGGTEQWDMDGFDDFGIPAPPAPIQNAPAPGGGGGEAPQESAPAAPQEPTPPTPEPQPAAPVGAQPTEPVQPTSPPAEPQQPVAAQPAQGQPSPGDSPGDGQPVQPAPQSLVQQIDAAREQLTESLAQGVFKLTQQESDALESGDATVVPKMLSRVYVETIRNTAAMLEQALPNMVAQAVTVQAANRAVDDAFYTQFPELSEHRAAVFQLGQTLRAMNREMPREQFFQKLGETARQVLGVQPTAAAPTGNGALASVAPGTPPAPAAPPSPVVSRVPQAPVGAPVAPPTGEDFWAQQSALFDADPDGAG